MTIKECPHCGALQPPVSDRFCSECREPLDERPDELTGQPPTNMSTETADPDGAVLARQDSLPFGPSDLAKVLVQLLGMYFLVVGVAGLVSNGLAAWLQTKKEFLQPTLDKTRLLPALAGNIIFIFAGWVLGATRLIMPAIRDDEN